MSACENRNFDESLFFFKDGYGNDVDCSFIFKQFKVPLIDLKPVYVNDLIFQILPIKVVLIFMFFLFKYDSTKIKTVKFNQQVVCISGEDSQTIPLKSPHTPSTLNAVVSEENKPPVQKILKIKAPKRTPKRNSFCY
jgi:hypothetical protein